MPQITAILEAARALRAATGVPVIADGGIKYSGDVVKALAAGAHSVMIGSLFAGTEECPGEQILLEGRAYKVYRGMGSLGAMAAAAAARPLLPGRRRRSCASWCAEGIEGRVPFKGPLADSVFQIVGGLRAGMGYCGVAHDRGAAHARRASCASRSAGLRESHPHDITITKEAPNYELH